MTFNKPTELMKLITNKDKRKSNERKKTITLNFHEQPTQSLSIQYQCNGHYIVTQTSDENREKSQQGNY